MYAILQRSGSEIDEEPHGKIEQSKTCQHLLGVNGREPFDRFDLDDHARLDEQIDSKGFAKAKPFIFE